MSSKILVTGGSGYIGTHICVELLKAGYEVVIFDNFSNSHSEALRRVEKISGKSVTIVHGDIRDQKKLETALWQHGCAEVIHFAGLKAVGESVERPICFYDNNVAGTLSLMRAMQAVDLKTLVFSSSATVYGEPQHLLLTEDHPLTETNPYGPTKLMIEDILRDLHRAEPDWRIAHLRYFNSVGADDSGMIGEDPKGIPNNPMPFIAQLAVGQREKLNVWGADYVSPDETGVRDYIHVVDMAMGHLKALEYLDKPQCFAVNLGTGVGYSVLDIVRTFEQATCRPIDYQLCQRRHGDVDASYANPALAEKSAWLSSQARYCGDVSQSLALASQ